MPSSGPSRPRALHVWECILPSTGEIISLVGSEDEARHPRARSRLALWMGGVAPLGSHRVRRNEFRPGRFEGAGMAFLRFERFLADATNASGPLGVVVFEKVRAHAGTLAAQVYGSFLAHLTAWCERHAVPYLGVPVATIKRHATGKGNASKDDVIKVVRAQGACAEG